MRRLPEHVVCPPHCNFNINGETYIYIINQWNLGYHILRQTDVIVWVVPQCCCTDPGTAVNILVGG